MSARFLALLASGCAGAPATTGGSRATDDFECRDRRAEYIVVGGFAAPEAGVRAECEGGIPRLSRWRLVDGERITDSTELSAEQFEALWIKIDATGWRHLADDCENPAASPGDPAYTMDVADHALARSFGCSGRTLPFPYDRIVNELDLRAAGLGDADDSPR